MRIFCVWILLSLQLALAGTTSLVGTVVTGVNPKSEHRAGDPLGGVSIEVLGTEFRTTSDANGTFRFVDLPSGEYTLVCRKDDFPEVRVGVRTGLGANCRVLMNPANSAYVGDFAVTPGTVYVAFSTRPPNEAGIESSPYALTEQKKWAAGVRPEQWSATFSLPKMPRGPGQAHLINDIIGESTFLMTCPPRSPGRTAFLRTPADPLWLCFDSTGRLLYVTSTVQKQAILEVRDCMNGHKLLKNLPMGGMISDLKLSSDGTTLVVTGSEGVTLVDTQTNLPKGRLPAPFPLTSAALAGHRLFVCGGNATSGTLVAYDITTGKEVGRCSVGHRPTHVELTPDCSRLLVACSGSASASLVVTLSVTEIKRIGTGNNPQRLAISPDGCRCFVANKIDNTVTVIDLQAMAVSAQIEVAREPSGLAFSRDGRQCFVACRKDGCLMMLDGKSGELTHTTVPQPNSVPYGVTVRP
ncbi:carboxypeptidase regulatory-like domain-containing protein [bacterium]|nr:carboxypeptidase regulatory-like domain-containing protein [bacterium]